MFKETKVEYFLFHCTSSLRDHQFELPVSDEHWMNINDQAKCVNFLILSCKFISFCTDFVIVKMQAQAFSSSKKQLVFLQEYEPRITVTYKSRMLSNFANATLQVAQFNLINHGQNLA